MDRDVPLDDLPDEYRVYDEVPVDDLPADLVPESDLPDEYAPPVEDRRNLGPYMPADEGPSLLPAQAPGSGVIAPPTFAESDLAAIFGPRDVPPPTRVSAPMSPEQEADIETKMAALGEPSTGPSNFYNAMFRDQRLGPRLSEGPMPEIEVSAMRPKPVIDTRPPATWGDTLAAIPPTIGGRYEMKWIGAQELVAQHDARKKFYQAMFLPEIIQNVNERNANTPDERDRINYDEDPLAIEMAKRAGVRPDIFTRDWPSILSMSPQERAQYQEENRALIAEQDARLEGLAKERQDVAAELARVRPNFGGEWTGKAITFDAVNSLIADMAPSLAAGYFGGPAAGLGTMGALTFPEQYANLGNEGYDDATRLFGALAQTAAEVAPEAGVLEVALKTAAGKQALRNILGRFAEGKGGHIAGVALSEAASEDVTEAINIGLDMGLFGKDVTIPEALDRLARSGVIGGIMGGGTGALTAPLPEPDMSGAGFNEDAGPLDVRAFDAALRGAPDTLPPPTAKQLGDVLAPAPQELELTPPAGSIGDLPAISANAPAPDLPDIFNRTFPPRDQGTMPAPALTGSRAPVEAGGKGTAPIPPASQGTASTLNRSEPTPPWAVRYALGLKPGQQATLVNGADARAESDGTVVIRQLDGTVTRYPPGSPLPQDAEQPLSTALEPATPPASPAPQEPAPAPAPAAPAVSTAQEPPAGGVASPIVQTPSTQHLSASVPSAIQALKDPKQYTTINTSAGPVRLVNLGDETPHRVIHAFDEKGKSVGQLSYSTKPGEQPHVAVVPERQRQGIATAMYDLAEKTGGIIPPVNAEGQARLPEGQAFREGREAKRVAAAPTPAPVVSPPQKKQKKAKKASGFELPPPPATEKPPAEWVSAQVATDKAAAEKAFAEYREAPLAVKVANDAAINAAMEAVSAAKTFDKYATAVADLRRALDKANATEAPKPLERGEVYPTPEGPVRENVGAKAEEETGQILTMETTPDKFEEVINEFPALFEAPKKRTRASDHPTYGTYLSKEEAAKRIESWQAHAERQGETGENSGRVILSLFDLTGNWARPFADAGYDVRVFDIQNGADIKEFSVEWFADNMPDIAEVDGILIACPCTDFAGSGARWWKEKDADGQTEASKELVFQALRTVEFWRPRFWVLENPVGRIEELTGLPPARYSFQPHDFGDPYTKKTLLWGKFDTDLPVAPVEPTEGSKMHKKFGGKSQRTKNARSETPVGFAYSFFMANNYMDASPAERLLSQFPEAAGAIEQALAAGFSEAQIREVVTEPYENYEYAEARSDLRQLVKSGTPAGQPQVAEKKEPRSAKMKKKAAAPAPAETPPAVKGKETGKRETVVTAAGTKVETEFEVIDAADLVTSDNPAFPQQYQPRERGSRAVSAEQIAKIAGNLDPEQLGSNRHAEHGAPIIGKDDNLVESGNGRVMALRQMYARNPEATEKYRAFVAEQSGQDVSGMKAPILVRRRVTDMTPAERAKFTKEANRTAVAKMSAAEQAKLDQEMLTPEVMAKLPDEMSEAFDLAKGEGARFVSAFVSKFSPAERGELVDADGKPSALAVSRAKAALLTKAYGGTPAGDAAIRRAVESTSTDAQTLVNTLIRFAAPFAQLREEIAAGRVQDEADIGPKIAEAIEVVRNAGSPAAVTEWLNTEDMLDPKDETVKQLIQTFYSFDGRGNVKRLRAAGAIGATLKEYLTLARQFRPEQAGGGLFGDEGAAPILKPAAELGKLNEARRAKEQTREREEAGQATAQGGLFTAGGKPSAAVSSRARDEESRQGSRSAGPRAGGDASRFEAQEEGDDFLDELRRPQRRKSKRRPGPYSMTREGEIRASQNEQIWKDAGLDPDLMELAPPPVRYQRAVEILQKRFGFRAITKAKNLNWGEAIDAIKDAYVGLSNLAAIQNVNPEVMSLNGRITLSLEREHAGALAYYDAKTMTIGMTRRNDAFAHEWAHALDHYLVETFAPEMLAIKGRHLTGKTRAGGVAETMHDMVREAYIGVLNAMYFDGAKAATYIADLEKKIATARTDKTRLKFQTMLDNFRMGHSKKKGIESEYYEAAKAMDGPGTEGSDKDYWQRPTEMFARAYEASIGTMLAGLPSQHPFVTQSKRMYDEGRIGRMQVPYPQAADRTNIFAAMETLIRALRDASYVGTGNAPARIIPTDERFWKKAAPSLPPQVNRLAQSVLAKLAAPFKAQLAELHRADADQRQRDKQDQSIRNVKLNQAGLAGRRRWLANQGLKAIENINALPAMLAHSVRGILLTLEGKYAGNHGVAWLRSQFATDPGSGRLTGATWNSAIRSKDNEYQNRFADIVKKHGVRGFDDAELRQLRDVLVNAIPESSVPDKIKHAAADMRRFLNDMYDYNVSNGVEIGYAKNGYLPRIMNAFLIENDPEGFRTQARTLYARVYPKEVGTLDSLLDDPLENPKGLKNLIQYVREIAGSGNVADARDIATDLLEPAKELEEALAELKQAADDGQDTTDIEDRINELGAIVYDGLREAWAMEATQDWENRIRGFGTKVPEFAFESRDPSGKYTKSRVLPEETDAIMGDYLKNDPLELITTYISQSVRRVEFGKFFGNPTKTQPLGWKLDAALHAANMPYQAADGSMQRITADDFEELEKSIELLVGRYNTNMTKKALRYRMKTTALFTPVILARSLKAQITEPLVVYRKTGYLTDALRVYYDQMQDLAVKLKLGTKSAKEKALWRREMSEYFGIVANHFADQLMLQRYNLMDLNSSDRVKMQRFFQVIGVHPHAMSMRRGVADIFMTRYAPLMAERALKGGAKGKMARGALAELGLDVARPGLIAELAKLRTVKDVDALNQFQHIDAIRTAINRFTDQAVQNPTAVDKPRLASMPEYSFMYGILSFLFAYQRNVLVATAKEIRRAWQVGKETGGVTGGVTLAGAQTISALASLSLIAAGQLAAWVLGVALWSDDDWEESQKKMTEPQGFGPLKMPAWVWQSLSRSGMFGVADPVVNAFMGLKYERDLSALTAGAIPSMVLGAIQNVVRPALSDSQTNTLAHRGTESLWNVGLGSLVTAQVLKIAGGNPLIDAALGMGLPYLTSPLVSDWVADTFVGDTQAELKKDAAAGDIDAMSELEQRKTDRDEEDMTSDDLDADLLNESL